MTYEQMERMMQFILEQQANLAISQQKGEERMQQAEARMTKIEDVMLRLANSQVATNERVTTLDETLQRLAKAHAETDERLNALINTVERYISERRNGN
jgi:predicted transcriptional regulator